jgi:N utilization substance protein B
LEDPRFVVDLVRGALDHLEEINKVIERAAPQWPLDQIAIVDRNVLRLGLFELMWGDRGAVPPKVH